MTSDAYGQPKKPTSPWVWIGVGCGAMVVAVVAFVAFIMVVVFGSMRSSTPYKESVARAQSDPRVIALLGSPVKPAPIFGGSIHTQNDDGDASFTINLSGPKGKGVLYVQATKKHGEWTYQDMTVRVKDQKVNLLEESPDTAPPVS